MFGDPSDNPFDWPARKLSTIGSLRNGVNFKANDKGFEIRSLGVSDFKDRSEIHDMELISKVEMSNPPRPTQLLQDGDVVFVRSNGNKELVGRCLAVYPGETPLTFSGFCISFRNETPSLALGYLLGFFKAQSTREKMRGRGANIQNLNQQILGELDVPMPPIELQQEFCGFVRQVDKSKFALQKTLDDLDAMTRKLMSEELGLGNV